MSKKDRGLLIALAGMILADGYAGGIFTVLSWWPGPLRGSRTRGPTGSLARRPRPSVCAACMPAPIPW